MNEGESMKHFFSFIVLFCVANIAFGFSSFMPKNDLFLQDSFVGSNITESQFNQVIKRVEYLYTPIVEGLGKKLIIQHDWKDSTVNAYAWQSGNTFYIKLFGGLARRSEINIAGFAIVACHEMGHHLGGFPQYWHNPWAASEGQSDYYATHVCAKKLWDYDYVEDITPSKVAKRACDTYLYDDYDRIQCYRSLDGAVGLAMLLGGGKAVAINTPDKSLVKTTNLGYPGSQCRLDTYVAGAICTASWDDKIIPTTESQSTPLLCTDSTNRKRQARPRCWFKPGS